MKRKLKILTCLCIAILVGSMGIAYAGNDAGKTEDHVVIQSGNIMVDSLNLDLSEEWASFIQYKKHDWEAEISKGDLVNPNFFKISANDKLGHIDELGHRIVALGGIPTKKPAPIVEGGDLRKKLQDDLAIENVLIQQYTEHIKIAISNGDTETQKILEKILSDEEKQQKKLEDSLGIK